MTNALALQWADIVTEQIRADCKRRSREIPDDVKLRYTFIPYCIAQGCWDMADTIIDMAIQMRLTPTKPLSRAIRSLKRDYDRTRAPYASPREETDNYLQLENDEKETFSGIYSSIKTAVCEQYPELDSQNTMLLCAVYACHIMLQVLFQFAEKSAAQLQKLLKIDDLPKIVPSQLIRLNPLILQFAGDKPLIIPDKQKHIDALVNDLLNTTFPDDNTFSVKQ